MEYMESKMQDQIEAGMHEYEELMELHNPPVDWLKPKWGEHDRVHGWRNYVSDGLKREWPSFTGRQKIMLASAFEALANAEDWE